MKVTFKVEGLRELEKQLDRISKSTGKRAVRKALKEAAQPMADLAERLAPKGPDPKLAPSIAVGTKLSKRQAKLHRRMFRTERAAVEMFLGPGPDPAAWNQEFGNINMGPQPFMRPAWMQDREAMLKRLSENLWVEIRKAVVRAENRAAKAARK